MKLAILGSALVLGGLWWIFRCRHEMIMNSDKHSMWLECIHCPKRTIGMEIGKKA